MASPSYQSPGKIQAAYNGMMGYQGSPVRGGVPPGQFQSRGTYDYAVSGSAGSRENTQSPSSPQPSVSSSETVTGHHDRGSASKHGSALNNHVNAFGSPMSQSSQNIGNHGSPARDNIQGATIYGSPQTSRKTPRGSQDLGNVYDSQVNNVYGTPQLAPRRESFVSQGAGSSYGSPSRKSSASTGSFARGPVLPHPSLATNNMEPQTMYAIPEECAVQEFAFRRGQQDRGNTRDRVPASPFHPSFDVVWEKHYQQGKRSSNDAIELPENPPSPSRDNYDWPPLINPWTQTPEHPKGIFHAKWARDTCEIALDVMESLIRTVCKRCKEWDRIVCDMPLPLVDTLQEHPDLLKRYDALKRAAREASAGGLPAGFSSV